jgi:CTP:molybdopterin cytidylyltransferase MocA
MPPENIPVAVHGLIVLAAGNSSRLQQSKQLLRYRGESLVRRAARLGLSTAPFDAVVVVGAQADAVFSEVVDLAVRRVDCADWPSGMGASLRAGVAALRPACVGVLVVLCDQPALDSAHLDAVTKVWHEMPVSGVASYYRGHAGVPALLPRSWFSDLAVAAGDRGARDLIAARAEQIRLLTNESLALDIDRPEDLSNLI